jgi:hypothetical protein
MQAGHFRSKVTCFGMTSGLFVFVIERFGQLKRCFEGLKWRLDRLKRYFERGNRASNRGKPFLGTENSFCRAKGYFKPMEIVFWAIERPEEARGGYSKRRNGVSNGRSGVS